MYILLMYYPCYISDRQPICKIVTLISLLTNDKKRIYLKHFLDLFVMFFCWNNRFFLLFKFHFPLLSSKMDLMIFLKEKKYLSLFCHISLRDHNFYQHKSRPAHIFYLTTVTYLTKTWNTIFLFDNQNSLITESATRKEKRSLFKYTHKKHNVCI